MTSTDRAAEPSGSDVDAVMSVTRALAAVSARSVAPVDDSVTLPQLRALIAVASHGTLTSAGLADALGVHASSATRICDRLVGAGLLDRHDNPTDRRYLLLELTNHGSALVESIMRRRRAAIKQILSRIPVDERAAITAAFDRFAAAAGDAQARDLWSAGWQS